MNFVTLGSRIAFVAAAYAMAGCTNGKLPAPAPAPASASASAPAPAPAPAPASEKVTYGADAFFEHASAKLSSTAKAKLNDLASKVKGQNLEAIVAAGHANRGEAPTAAAIQSLSVRRAEAVKSYLLTLGVDRNLVYTEGKGATQPIAVTNIAGGEAKNRRVEVEVVSTSPNGKVETVSAPAPIVYNADLTPQHVRNTALPDRPVLKAGLPTTLSFDIGPKSLTSVLPFVPAAAAIIASVEDVPLTIVLACGFCEPQGESLKRVTYRPGEGRSDKAKFQFTPLRRAGASDYTGKLYLSIINDKSGREYDRLVLPVAVVSEGMLTTTNSNQGTVLTPSTVVDSSEWRPDVVLYANAQADRNVTISIQPVSAAMRQLLGPLALDAQNSRRVFRTGIDDPELVDAMANSAFGAMSAVSLQGELLKKLSATGVEAAVSKNSQASLELSDTESRRVTDVIARSGQRLYRHLFSNSADTDLRKLIQQLEMAAAAAPKDKPLRMMIVTDRLTLPWQYIHPIGPDVKAEKFWGMQFSLSVLRVNNKAPKKAIANRTSDERKVLFAHYGRSADPTILLAQKQAAQLLKLPLAKDGLLKVDTGAGLLAKVSSQRKHIGGIVTFLHASAGSADTPPNLQFNVGDIVTSDTLEDLLNKVSAEEQDLRYLAEGPLVILNACETGPARNLPHVKLQNAMFQLGAQGVVVTEVSVWISLGHEVATQLIDRLGQGEPVSDALTAVRRQLYKQKKNPLGLLYVYYGDPAATFWN